MTTGEAAYLDSPRILDAAKGALHDASSVGMSSEEPGCHLEGSVRLLMGWSRGSHADQNWMR